MIRPNEPLIRRGLIAILEIFKQKRFKEQLFEPLYLSKLIQS